ncbi:hypothetical protein KIP88_09235 [Bradyrhizobium sp. SRL28]|uniref:hypothetical protein n=1 Tax=Bradyrhizobium sp. SRL28 TaxID=2836178 RepID=UPI001BDE330B|nr:hypothetical protein [Bradyrhizobium sp. SRL28]MBT1510685.1 hypothetical protein [Bradyrhizobium sp. SRL28]
MTPRKRGDLGTKGLNFGKREVVSSLRHTLVSLRQQFVCQKKQARHFAYICSALLRGDNRPRRRSLLCLLAKTAARTRILVFYYAVPVISGKALLKGRLSAP